MEGQGIQPGEVCDVALINEPLGQLVHTRSDDRVACTEAYFPLSHRVVVEQLTPFAEYWFTPHANTYIEKNKKKEIKHEFKASR